MNNPKWKYHDDYVQCADCKTLRPLAELKYRRFVEVTQEGKAGEHHCADPGVCQKMREDRALLVAPVQAPGTPAANSRRSGHLKRARRSR
jgi:hypothetical protein